VELATSGTRFKGTPAGVHFGYQLGYPAVAKDKGALRMMFGLRVVRAGLVGALVAIALPVAAFVGTAAVSVSAVAQTASSIVVEGNRRVEADTIRSYFRAGPGGRLDALAID